MYYTISLQDVFFDEHEETYGYYTIEALDEDDVEWPWVQGAPFPAGGPQRSIALALDPEEEDAGAFADWVSGPVPLVSARFRNVLEQSGVSNLVYYPVTLRGADEFVESPVYFAVNVVGLIAVASSETESRKTFGATGADMIDKLVIAGHVNSELLFFRMAEHVSTVVIAESVKLACEAAGIDTLSFQPLELFTT